MKPSRPAPRRWSERRRASAAAALLASGLGAGLLLVRGAAAVPAAAVAAPAVAPPSAPAAAGAGAPGAVSFIDVAGAAGLTLKNWSGAGKATINETVGNGACLYDVDDDGWLDIFLPNGQPGFGAKGDRAARSALYRNRGDGTFEDITEKAGVASRGYWAQGCVFGDYDDDGKVDLLVTGFGHYILYHNLGGGRFQDVTAGAGFVTGGWSTAAAFGDYDGDGRIDLYVSHYVAFDETSPPLPTPGAGVNCMYRGFPVICGPRGLKPAIGHLYHNEGGGRFKDVTARAGLRTEPTSYGLGVIWSDLDLDGDLDLVVINDSTPNLLYRNDGKGTFTEIGSIAGVAYNEEGRSQAGMGVDAADYDNDGLFDLVVTNFSHDYSTLRHNEGGLFFLDVSMSSGFGPPTMPTLGWGIGFLDYDNDGRKDIFIANGHVYPDIDRFNLGTTFKEPCQLFHNEGGGRFKEVGAASGPAFRELHSSRGAAFGDFDNDGDIDVVVNRIDEPPGLLRNDGGNRNHWIGFRLVGAPVNRGAVGARVMITTGTVTQMGEIHAGSSHNSSSDPRLHFGLGSATAIDRAQIIWPGGQKQELAGLAVDRYHTVRQAAAPRGAPRSRP